MNKTSTNVLNAVLLGNPKDGMDKKSHIERFLEHDFNNIVSLTSYVNNNSCNAYFLDYVHNPNSKGNTLSPDGKYSGLIRMIGTAEKYDIENLIQKFKHYIKTPEHDAPLLEIGSSMFSIEKSLFEHSLPAFKFIGIETEKYIAATNMTLEGRPKQSNIALHFMTPLQAYEKYDLPYKQ